MAGTAGRYRTRFGKRIRNKISKIEKEATENTKCPDCDSQRLEKEYAGIWKCKKCSNKFSGGAWKPKTGAEKLISKALKKHRR